MKAMHMISYILVMIGALNWGLVGLGWLTGGANWNLVHLIFGQWMSLEAIIYVLVGLAALWLLVMGRSMWKMGMASPMTM